MLNDDWKKIVVDGETGEEFTAVNTMGQYKIQVALELLEGCSYNCPGCFVKRKGNYHPASITRFYNLASELRDRTDIVLDDIVIGPTDFFGAENLWDIINDTRLARAILWMPKDNRNIQHNCSILGSLSEKDIKGKIKDIENSALAVVVESWDVQIALDLNLLMTDESYRQALHERVKTFEESSLNYEISMATNVVDGVEDIIYDAIDYVRETYSTVIEILPSVVRSFHHGSKHGDKLFQWNNMLTHLASDVNRFKNKFHFLQGDVSHKAYNYSVINIHQGKMFMSPFIYENAQIYSEHFEIPPTTSYVDSIMDYKNYIVNKQFESSANKECGSCKYLNTCVNRLIPHVMDTVFNGRKECILNKDVIGLFDNEAYYGNSYQ